MGVEDPDKLEKVDQEIRINELKEQVREVAGEMTTYENPDAPPDILEGFWKGVLDYENAPLTCEAEELKKAGLVFPPAEALSDAELPKKLWELIEALSRRNTYLYQTDHLSDRELYVHLTKDSLLELGPEMPRGPGGWSSTIDMLGGYGEEEIKLSHIYYSDDEERARWIKDFPNYVMPERKPRPFDRDRLLPVPPEELERRAWLAEMHAKGYTDEDINRMCQEEMEAEMKEFEAGGDMGDDGESNENVP